MFARSWACLFLLASSIGDAFALSYVMPTDEALVEQAEGAALMRVEGRLPAMSGALETLYVMSVERELGNGRVHPLERLALPGSRVPNGISFWAVGVPTLGAGDRVLVLHRRRSDGVLQPEQLTLGLFFRIETPSGDVYQRALPSDGNVAKSHNADYSRTRDAPRFETWLAARARGAAAAPDYFLDAQPERGALKFNQTRDSGTPVRWFKFDSNQSESWMARNDGQANTSFDEFVEFQQALAAWTNDTGSKILYTYGGTTAVADVTCASPSVITWNDPLGAIAGSYNCATGGTLGIGGPCYFLSTQDYKGTQEYPVFEGRVIIQDNAGCFMDGHSGADGAELMTHELGHSLGLDHSCEFASCTAGSPADLATMRSRAHGDGRGAVLGVDDKNAVAAIYFEAATIIFADSFE